MVPIGLPEPFLLQKFHKQSYTSSQGKDIPSLMLQLFHTDIESFWHIFFHHIFVCDSIQNNNNGYPSSCPPFLKNWNPFCMDVGMLVCSCLHSIKRRAFYALMLLGSGIGSTLYLHFPLPRLSLPPSFFVSTSLQLLTFVICYLHFSLSLSFCFLHTSLPHVILSHSCACHHILKIEGHAISYIISMLLETQQWADALGRCRSTVL